MSVSYTVDESRGIVFTRAWGALRDEELAAHATALREDGRFHPAFRQLANFLGVTDLKVTPAGIRHLVELTPFAKVARRALVVHSDAGFGMARMFQLSMDASETVLVCRTLAQAFDWLGLDQATPWPLQVDKTFESGNAAAAFQ